MDLPKSRCHWPLPNHLILKGSKPGLGTGSKTDVFGREPWIPAGLTGTARQQAEPGRGDERFKLIPKGTGKALIPDQDAGL